MKEIGKLGPRGVAKILAHGLEAVHGRNWGEAAEALTSDLDDMAHSLHDDEPGKGSTCRAAREAEYLLLVSALLEDIVH